MDETPVFQKPDRYKASSYRSYNSSMPGRYDTAWFQTLCQLPLWHRVVVEELRPEIESLRILDVGCGTGSLLADMARCGAASLDADGFTDRLRAAARCLGHHGGFARESTARR